MLGRSGTVSVTAIRQIGLEEVAFPKHPAANASNWDYASNLVFRITLDTYMIDVEYHDMADVLKEITDNILQFQLLGTL